jgi:uncharacterized protein YdhG (YjbR/CyaY superfamily)
MLLQQARQTWEMTLAHWEGNDRAILVRGRLELYDQQVCAAEEARRAELERLRQEAAEKKKKEETEITWKREEARIAAEQWLLTLSIPHRPEALVPEPIDVDRIEETKGAFIPIVKSTGGTVSDPEVPVVVQALVSLFLIS